MEVTAYIHESVPETFTRDEGEGTDRGAARIIFVRPWFGFGPLAHQRDKWGSDEVGCKYFVSVVKLDEVPSGMKPGMTAEIEFDVDRRQDVLAVASEAVSATEGGRYLLRGRDRRSRAEGPSMAGLPEP